MNESEFQAPWEGRTPDRKAAEAVWAAVAAGTMSRELAHAWSVPWVEGNLHSDDEWVNSAMQYLHGCDLVIGDPARPTVVRHGGWGQYYKTLHDIGDELAAWRADIELSERDPDAFRIRREQQLRMGLARDMSPERVERVMAQFRARRQQTASETDQP